MKKSKNQLKPSEGDWSASQNSPMTFYIKSDAKDMRLADVHVTIQRTDAKKQISLQEAKDNAILMTYSKAMFSLLKKIQSFQEYVDNVENASLAPLMNRLCIGELINEMEAERGS